MAENVPVVAELLLALTLIHPACRSHIFLHSIQKVLFISQQLIG